MITLEWFKSLTDTEKKEVIPDLKFAEKQLILSDLLSAGYSLSALLSAGYSMSALRSAGYSASALLSAGYSASALRSAGYSASDLEKKEVTAKKDIQEKAKKMGREESDFVLSAIKKGLLKGDSYGSLEKCGCFLGSAAKKAGKSVDEYCKLKGIVKNQASAAEQWFMAIDLGDTPENNYAAKKAAEWIEEVFPAMEK